MKTLKILIYITWGLCVGEIILFILSPQISKLAACLWVATAGIWALNVYIREKKRNLMECQRKSLKNTNMTLV